MKMQKRHTNRTLYSLLGTAALSLTFLPACDGGQDILTVAKEIQSSTAYTLTNLHAGRCLDVEGASSQNGANILLWDCHGGENQQFTFEPTSDGYYLIRSVATGKCFDVWGWSTEAGANIAQYDCHGGENQQFAVEDVASGGVVRIVSRLSGHALDGWEWGTTNGTDIVQWPVTGGDNQHFYATIVGSTDGGGSTDDGSTDDGSGSSSDGCTNVTDWGEVNATIVVDAGETFDGNCQRFWAGPEVGDGSQSESQDPIFRLEDGATLRNVVLGAPAADGIHTYGDVSLSNITWEDVGEDALTIKESGTVVLDGGSARDASDKIFQINAASTFRVSNITAHNAGKFIRQNGGTDFRVDVFIDSCDISDMDEAIFRTDSDSSTVTMTNTRYSNIGDELFMGVNPNNITLSGNTEY